MKFFSLNGSPEAVTFQQAMRRGLAPDRGLYFPEQIPVLPEDFWLQPATETLAGFGSGMLENFWGQDAELFNLLDSALDFPVELRELSDWMPGAYVLELFHGPTAAFKDVGARVMSRLLSASSDERLTVLVATSGDTGSAVAQGFVGMPNIDVVILYPSGRISKIQEQQLTTVGENVQALEVTGSFDDCQAMVKAAFLDRDLQAHRPLTSANSINVARWMPQAIYYAWANFLLGEPAHFVVPSGNLGNLAAGVLAAKMGMPAKSFTAATNANDAFPQYLSDGTFKARPSIATLSNAMDVGDPSNRPRLEKLCGGTEAMQKAIRGAALNDEETLDAMRKVYDSTGYIACPHTAVGLEVGRRIHGASEGPVVMLATADPAKFGSVVEQAIAIQPPVPQALQECMSREKRSTIIGPSLDELKAFLMA